MGAFVVCGVGLPHPLGAAAGASLPHVIAALELELPHTPDAADAIDRFCKGQ